METVKEIQTEKIDATIILTLWRYFNTRCSFVPEEEGKAVAKLYGDINHVLVVENIDRPYPEYINVPIDILKNIKEYMLKIGKPKAGCNYNLTIKSELNDEIRDEIDLSKTIASARRVNKKDIFCNVSQMNTLKKIIDFITT